MKGPSREWRKRSTFVIAVVVLLDESLSHGRRIWILEILRRPAKKSKLWTACEQRRTTTREKLNCWSLFGWSESSSEVELWIGPSSSINAVGLINMGLAHTMPFLFPHIMLYWCSKNPSNPTQPNPYGLIRVRCNSTPNHSTHTPKLSWRRHSKPHNLLNPLKPWALGSCHSPVFQHDTLLGQLEE